MKQNYFTFHMLEQKAVEMLQMVEKSSHLRERRFKPTCSALLVLDMQDYFLEASSHAYVPSASVVLPTIKALVQAYYAHDLLVVFTQHLNTPQDAGLMGVWWRDLLAPENPWSNITTDLDTSKGTVLRKSQYDAFYKTSLQDLLQTRGVSQVVISGVMTHLCCETTARSGFMRGLEVFFLIDGTATYNEDFHRAALLNLSHGFAVPVLQKDILSAFEEIP